MTNYTEAAGILQIWYPDGKGLPPAFALGNGKVMSREFRGSDLEDLLKPYNGLEIRLVIELLDRVDT